MICGSLFFTSYQCAMHELAVMAQSIDEMKVNIAWITECFCSGVIIMCNV